MKKTLITLSVIINILLLAVVLVLVSGGFNAPLIKLFIQQAHNRRVSQFGMLEIERGNIIFLGDSITEGGSWHEFFPEEPVHNRGIGGDTTSGVLKRLHQVTEGKPSKVFLLIGTNDLANNNTEVVEIINNIKGIVETINQSSPETQVFVQSILPRAASFRENIEAINIGVQQAIAGKAEWINLYPLFLDAQGGSIRDDLANDELHLMGAGYLVWQDAIRQFVVTPSHK